MTRSNAQRHDRLKHPIRNREELVNALCDAAEIEQLVLLEYLFATYSLKKGPEDGLSPGQQEMVRSWNDIVATVARQEMAHLGMVFNLLSAIGAPPHVGRPNFPQPIRSSSFGGLYGFDFGLRRFSDEALYWFIRAEIPEGEKPPKFHNGDADPSSKLTFPARTIEVEPIIYDSVGELYRKIDAAFRKPVEPNLFVGEATAQDADDWSHRMILYLVRNEKQAHHAVDFIVREGEGTGARRGTSHYATFTRLRDQLAAAQALDKKFDPARPVAVNPRTWHVHRDAGPGTFIENQPSRSIAQLCNRCYRIVLLMLAQYYSFGGETPTQRKTLRNELRHLMTAVMRPLGEIVTTLPIEDGPVVTAGAPFEMYRQIDLSSRIKERWEILHRGLQDLHIGCSRLARSANYATEIRDRLRFIGQNVDWIGRKIREGANEQRSNQQDIVIGRVPKPRTERRARFQFQGWFQCRLATDPDPPDERRGVSGYIHALPNEPDLDRVIRFQPERGIPVRPFIDPIKVGVTVTHVQLDTTDVTSLRGALVYLHGMPKFEGRNGIVAEDGLEPIVPFDIEVTKGTFSLRRAHLERDRYPYEDLKAGDVQAGMPDVGEATSIFDLWSVWTSRADQIRRRHDQATEPAEIAALESRLKILNTYDLTRYFAARMLYSFSLTGKVSRTDPDGLLDGIELDKAWHVDFWMGGWDPDALCGYVKGLLTVPGLVKPRLRSSVRSQFVRP